MGNNFSGNVMHSRKKRCQNARKLSRKAVFVSFVWVFDTGLASASAIELAKKTYVASFTMASCMVTKGGSKVKGKKWRQREI